MSKKKTPEEKRETRRRYLEANRIRLREQAREWNRKNPRDRKATYRFWKYGVTNAEFHSLINSQAGQCAICEDQFDDRDRAKWACIDHDHGSGSVRGLLCSRCNIAIGNFRDSFELCVRAANYLLERRSK